MRTDHGDPVEEYEALRSGCGLLEYTGAAVLTVSGHDAVAFLGEIATRGVDFLLEGQSCVALMLREDGTIVSEVTIHCRRDDYLLEVWPAQAAEGKAHLLDVASDYTEVTVTDHSDGISVLALEGPSSFSLVGGLVPFAISSMGYQSFMAGSWGEVPVEISRTGVTGEYGYKVFVGKEQAEPLAAELLAAGATRVGTDALDICRMEMRFPNLEREGAGGVTPFGIGAQWMVDFSHEFTGKKALLEHWESGIARTPVCFVSDAGDGAAVPTAGQRLQADDEEIGAVVHAVASPRLGKAIGTARVDGEVAASGQEFALAGDGGPVRTVSAPFLVPSSFGVPME
jgi:glycine cleavage system aminomethyltransferase T